MNRGIIILLVTIIVLGLAALYALEQGPVLLLRGPSEDRIAFASDRGGQVDIWTMRADGSDVRPVTRDTADDQDPTWSPDKRELASVSDRRDRVYQVFLSAWDGRYTHDLTSSDGTKGSPLWSTDGREITFLNGGKICTVPRTGGNEDQILPLPGMPDGLLPGSFIFGDWSTDDETLLCVQATDQGELAYAVNRGVLDSWEQGPLNKTDIAAGSTVNAAWSPRGHVVAVAFVDRHGENGILIRDLDAGGSKLLFAFKGNTMGPGKLAWSPDGKRIVFEMWSVQDSTLNRSQGIYVVEASGGRPKLLVKGDCREPCWSSDGTQIAFTRMGAKERRDIWRVNSDGTGAVNLTRGEGDNSSPAWSPSSREK